MRRKDIQLYIWEVPVAYFHSLYAVLNQFYSSHDKFVYPPKSIYSICDHTETDYNVHLINMAPTECLVQTVICSYCIILHKKKLYHLFYKGTHNIILVGAVWVTALLLSQCSIHLKKV